MKKNGKLSKREIQLAGFRFAGYHGDRAMYTRGLVESRLVSMQAANAEWAAGVRMRKNGVPCSCRDCTGGAA
jgi:hypothetical protein